MSQLQRGYLYYAMMDKRRPVLVISYDSRNASASDVLVIPCSTIIGGLPTHVRLTRGEGGVPRSSVLKCEQITNAKKVHIDAIALGRQLSAARLRQVEAAVMRAIGIPIPID